MDSQEKQRLFVGGLFNGIQEEDIVQKFSKFGKVIGVNLKVKNYENGNNTFAFVDLETNQLDLSKCIKTLNKARWNGSEMKLELARESFLSRLKREREHSNPFRNKSDVTINECNRNDSNEFASQRKDGISQEKHQKVNDVTDDKGLPNSHYNKTPINGHFNHKQNVQRKRPHSSQGSVLLGELEKFNDMWKDPGTEYMSSVQTTQNGMHLPLTKQQRSEFKRLQAVQAKLGDTATKSKFIKESLRNLNSNKKCNKKIKFDNYDGDDANNEKSSLSSTSNLHSRLFDSGSEEDAEDIEKVFRVRPEYEGETGQKLIDLHSRFGNDERFKLDARFADEVVDQPHSEGSSPAKEKQRHLEVLEDVLGYQLPKRKLNSEDKQIAQHPKRVKLLRYDPTNADAMKLEIRQPELNELEDSKRKALKPSSEDVSEANSLPEVSKERFYHVSDSLKDVLGTRKQDNEGFSLIESYGVLSRDTHDKSQNNDVSEILQPPRSNWDTNPFKYDSSDDEKEDHDHKDSIPAKKQLSANNVSFHSKSPESETQPKPPRRETFFIFDGDSRLTDGVEFFKRHDDMETIRRNWLQNKDWLMHKFKQHQKRAVPKARVNHQTKKQNYIKMLNQRKPQNKYLPPVR